MLSEWLGNPGKGTSRSKNPKNFLGEPAPDPAKSLRFDTQYFILDSRLYPLQNILGNLLDKLRLVIVHECNGHLEKF